MTLTEFRRALRTAKRVYVNSACVAESAARARAFQAADVRTFQITKKEARRTLSGSLGDPRGIIAVIASNGDLYIG